MNWVQMHLVSIDLHTFVTPEILIVLEGTVIVNDWIG